MVSDFAATGEAAEEDGEDYDAYYGCDRDYGGLVDAVVALIKLMCARWSFMMSALM